MSNADTHEWRPMNSGFYLIMIGIGGSPTFNSANIDVTQNGIAVSTALTNAAAAVRERVYLLAGAPVVFTPSAAVTSVEVGIANADD